MEMVLRKTAQALDLLSGQANWEPMGGPSVSALDPWPALIAQP